MAEQALRVFRVDKTFFLALLLFVRSFSRQIRGKTVNKIVTLEIDICVDVFPFLQNKQESENKISAENGKKSYLCGSRHCALHMQFLFALLARLKFTARISLLIARTSDSRMQMTIQRQNVVTVTF